MYFAATIGYSVCIRSRHKTVYASNVNSNVSLAMLRCNVNLPILTFESYVNQPFKSWRRENSQVHDQRLSLSLRLVLKLSITVCVRFRGIASTTRRVCGRERRSSSRAPSRYTRRSACSPYPGSCGIAATPWSYTRGNSAHESKCAVCDLFWSGVKSLMQQVDRWKRAGFCLWTTWVRELPELACTFDNKLEASLGTWTIEAIFSFLFRNVNKFAPQSFRLKKRTKKSLLTRMTVVWGTSMDWTWLWNMEVGSHSRDQTGGAVPAAVVSTSCPLYGSCSHSALRVSVNVSNLYCEIQSNTLNSNLFFLAERSDAWTAFSSHVCMTIHSHCRCGGPHPNPRPPYPETPHPDMTWSCDGSCVVMWYDQCRHLAFTLTKRTCFQLIPSFCVLFRIVHVILHCGLFEFRRFLK